MRVKLSLPERPSLYQTSITLGVADMNYGNHLGNDKVLTLAHETRLRFFREIDQEELNFFSSALIMGDAAIQYKGQGYMGDLCTIRLWISEVSPFGFDLIYSMTKNEGKSEIARVKTGMIFFDYDLQKMAKTPQSFLDYFQSKGN